jgi:hypothetical protein
VSRDSGAIAAQVLAGKVRSLNSVRPDLPVPLSNAVEKALRRDLSLRYRSMAEFARGLLVGATASDIRVPEDPDPVGFPEFATWHGQAKLDSTVEVYKSESPPPAPAEPAARTSAAHELAVAATAVDTGSLPKRGFGKGVVVLAALVMLALVAVWFWSAQKPATEALEHPPAAQHGSMATPPPVQQAETPPVQAAPVEPPSVEPAQVPTSDSPQAQPGATTAQTPPPASNEKSSARAKSGKRKAASASKPTPEQKPSDIEVEWK